MAHLSRPTWVPVASTVTVALYVIYYSSLLAGVLDVAFNILFCKIFSQVINLRFAKILGKNCHTKKVTVFPNFHTTHNFGYGHTYYKAARQR
jgi:hypothetical protein